MVLPNRRKIKSACRTLVYNEVIKGSNKRFLFTETWCLPARVGTMTPKSLMANSLMRLRQPYRSYYFTSRYRDTARVVASSRWTWQKTASSYRHRPWCLLLAGGSDHAKQGHFHAVLNVRSIKKGIKRNEFGQNRNQQAYCRSALTVQN